MALSANANYKSDSDGAGRSIEIVDAEVVYHHAFVAINHAQWATTAARGRINAFTSSNFRIPLGLSIDGPITGSASASPPPHTKVATHTSVVRLPVTGIAGNASDVGKEVWFTDDGTMTLTRAAKAAWAGVIVAHVDTDDAYVMMPSAMESFVHQRSVSRYTWHAGVVSLNIASAGSVVMADIKMPHHGRLVEAFANIISAGVGSTASIDIYFRKGSSNISGGTITVTGNVAIGALVSATSVFAGTRRYFHEDDLLDIRLAHTSGSAGGAGLANVYCVIETELGQ